MGDYNNLLTIIDNRNSSIILSLYELGSAQRITNSLITIGYLAKDKKTKKFRLTPKWLSIGFGILAGLEIRKIALPHLKHWRTTGQAYVKDYFDLMGVSLDEARFMETPGWCDWYDTDLSQEILNYQNTSYQEHLNRLRAEVERRVEE